MNESLERTGSDVMGLVERAYDEEGVANYGCFVEVLTMVRQRVSLLQMISMDDAAKKAIFNEMYDIVSSLPDLHDKELSRKHALRLQELLPI